MSVFGPTCFTFRLRGTSTTTVKGSMTDLSFGGPGIVPRRERCPSVCTLGGGRRSSYWLRLFKVYLNNRFPHRFPLGVRPTLRHLRSRGLGCGSFNNFTKLRSCPVIYRFQDKFLLWRRFFDMCYLLCVVYINLFLLVNVCDGLNDVFNNPRLFLCTRSAALSL